MKLQRQGKTSATLVDVGESQILYSYSTPVAAFVPGRVIATSTFTHHRPSTHNPRC